MIAGIYFGLTGWAGTFATLDAAAIRLYLPDGDEIRP